MLTRHLGSSEEIDWYEECRFRLALPKQALPLLERLPRDYFEQAACLVWFHEIPDLMGVADTTPTAAFHLWDFFLDILNDGSP